ncbi:Cut8-domain-containing protein [Eremomyces bilateralis CBS 781.70]|uniref:Tethering factor for nuclear proteasome STS1 n=1 Tax=Eremomyces bilateralis CBS 781.70 TaxID=1392243 RepID=A0A6G1FX52_9PEZI|nr:Cut8-domain-containing protein [Eremomyces bilateralis CBS 781.70]KAF1810271.1 Cut8-domain-containing protein [Eremomyces bilateralis CBS 781.70]
MNTLIPTQPLLAPHLLPNSRLSPSLSSPATSMSSRKRKADDDINNEDNEMRMSASPSNSPSMGNRQLPSFPSQRHTQKRLRLNRDSRSLALPRLLETLDQNELRSLLRTICDRNPQISAEVSQCAPRPSVGAVFSVLSNYENAYRTALPYGTREGSDYSYNRVRQPLLELLDALKDFTPNFLPPNEPQPTISLGYLDRATEIIHRLPEWDSFQHNRHKHDAYEELAAAWAVVIREASKRAGGIQLHNGEWDQKLLKHNEASGGRMEEALQVMRQQLGWISGDVGRPMAGSSQQEHSEPSSIRQQLLNGTYAQGVRVGPW